MMEGVIILMFLTYFYSSDNCVLYIISELWANIVSLVEVEYHFKMWYSMTQPIDFLTLKTLLI